LGVVEMKFAERESSKLVSNFCAQAKAQGTIEYLVIIGVLLIGIVFLFGCTSGPVGAMGSEASSEKDGTVKSYTDNGDGTVKSYTDNGDGTVTDNHTGLVWQKDHKDNCATLSWESALSYCSTLASGSGGLTDGSRAGDWRVPSETELITLKDYSYSSSGYLNSVFTQTGWNSTCHGYWSSTTVSNSTSYANALYSGYGSVTYVSKTLDYDIGVRCVRSGN